MLFLGLDRLGIDCPFCGETIYRDTLQQLAVVETHGCRICNPDYYDVTGE